ncbi:hypothetical protein GCM10027059_12380 [Myceligenerans halotolerans]
MTVYLLSDGDYLKIGHTTRDVERRVRELQTGSPREIRLIAVLPGASTDTERELHAQFAAYRVRANGEWFTTRRGSIPSSRAVRPKNTA